MITETRVLIVGVENDGKIHRELEVRPRYVKDLVAATADPAYIADKAAYEVCCLAAQITRLGDIPKDKITGEMLLEMLSDDFDVLTEAAEKARQRAISFRSQAPQSQKENAGADPAGIPPG